MHEKKNCLILLVLFLLLTISIVKELYNNNKLFEYFINYNFRQSGSNDNTKLGTTDDILFVTKDDEYVYISITYNNQLTYGVLLDKLGVSSAIVNDLNGSIVSNNNAAIGTDYTIKSDEKTYKIVVYGDANSDGTVNKNDYRAIANDIVNKMTISTAVLKASDTNKDGILKMNDVLMLISNYNTSTPEIYCDWLVQQGVRTIDYKNFTKIFNETYSQDYRVGDDYFGIKYAHECANRYDLPVKITQDTYNIYKYNRYEFIPVETDTDLNNSIFYIHDEEGYAKKDANGYVKINVIKNGTSTEKYDINDYYKGQIYKIQNKGGDIGCKTNLEANLTLANLVNKYAISSGKYIVTIENSNKTVFARAGSNTGEPVSDVFTVVNGQRIEPLFFDDSYYDSITKIKICPISDKQVTFKNATFNTIIDPIDYAKVLGIDSYTEFYGIARGLSIERSNTIVDNINHYFINEQNEIVNQVYASYNGFFRFSEVADVQLSNSKVQAVKYYRSYTNGAPQISSSYDLNNLYIVNFTLDNVKMNDYDNTSTYLSETNQLTDDTLWGVMTNNYEKNVTYNNCVLNRIDTHKAVYNLTIKNTIVGYSGISQTGFGDMNLENVTGVHTNYLISLRPDFGALWKGKISVKNSKIIPNNNDSVSLIDLTLYINNSDMKIYNYGFDLYIPNVAIDNFMIESNTTEFSVFDNRYFGPSNVDSLPNGDLEYAKNNYIPIVNGNKLFNLYYPKKNNITLSSISSNNSQLQTKNYLRDFNDENGCSVNTGCN